MYIIVYKNADTLKWNNFNSDSELFMNHILVAPFTDALSVCKQNRYYY
jgi:hypothetical protein